MKTKRSIFILFIAVTLFLIACKKSYEPPEIKVVTNFLVVDGTISCGNDAITRITLSRSKRLSDTTLFQPELNAQVTIEEQQGARFFLIELGDGVYQSPPLTLDPGKNYRLKITTSSGKNYSSAYTVAKLTPPIDSLTWKQEEDVTISVHTHDPSNNTRYYRWDYIETWTYESIFSTVWGEKNGLIYVKQLPLEQTDSCWRTANSTNIVVTSSVALSQDVISDFPVAIVPAASEKIGKRYSILVKQYALTPEAFRYLQLIQKNTQELGTLFDAQPSQLKGNIQADDDANEPVIGFITASTVEEKRIFISKHDVTDWGFVNNVPGCGQVLTIFQHPANFLIWDYPDPAFGPYYFQTGVIVIARRVCLECTERGGTNIKPPFW